MKKQTFLLTTLLFVGLLTVNVYGQIELPRPSPTATFSQKVGLTEISIEYSRPSIKDRVIFGDLVPYDKVWRTGANSATKITFADDVKIAGQDLKAGSYGLFTIPGKEEWTVIFNSNWDQWGGGKYNEEEDVLRIKVKPIEIPIKVETFLIIIENVRNTSASLELVWDNIVVDIPFTVEIDERITKSIEQALQISPGTYYQAASYYHESGKDLNQALTWINMALEKYEEQGRNVYWIYREKSLIQADLKKYKEAIASANKSMEKAKEAGNDDYVRMNEKSIAEWGKK